MLEGIKVSRLDIKERVEQVLSDILSNKYEAKIRIKFGGANHNGDSDTSNHIRK